MTCQLVLQASSAYSVKLSICRRQSERESSLHFTLGFSFVCSQRSFLY